MSKLHQAPDAPESSAGGYLGSEKVEAAKVRAAITSIKPVQDLSHIGTVPCARKSLLLGMATAAGITCIKVVAGRGMRRSLNWGVGSFCFVSLASWEGCRRTLKAEQARMKNVIEGYKQSGGRANKPSITTIAEQQANR